METIIQFSNSDQLLDIRYDRVFKAVFTQDNPASKGALSDLISTLIERKVSVTSIITNEPPITDIRDRNIRYDISCKTENEELVNIEMSLNPSPYEPVRLEYYSGKLFTRQDIHGEKAKYSDLKETFQIALLAKGRFFNDNALVHTFEYYDIEHNISLEGKSSIITVELAKTELVIEKSVEEMAAQEAWAAFFQYLTDISKRAKINKIVQSYGGIAMASEALIEITQDDIEWARQLSEEKYILDTQDMKACAWEEGMREGKLEGMRKGMLEGKQEVAKNLKANDVSIEIIAKSTGLSAEEIARL